jgi:hypothetical protein
MKFFSHRPLSDQDENTGADALGNPRVRGAVGLKVARPTRRLAAFVVAALALGFAGPVLADPPTVNGLFYGDGDDAKYVEYATSYLGSKLYIYYDAPTALLYTALVVNTAVNDNVFGQPDGRKTYMSSVGWGSGGGQQRGANKLTDSEFAQFTFACAPGSSSQWTWNQGYACLSGGTWVADLSCPTSSGATPPGYASASSFAWNINTYESAPTPKPWNRDIRGSGLGDWVSPFDASQSPPVALGLDGYPSLQGAGFSDQYQWEWRMVYEWSIPLGPNGANCGGNLLYVVTGLSHHSPLKEELGLPPPECGDPENDCFPGDITVADPLSDYGDLPEIYGTTQAAGGPHHYVTVTGPYLGQEVVFELDGQPTADATGDGAEEDGVTAVVNDNWTAGSTQTISVDVSNAPAGALLGAWFDWNGDGDLTDPGEFFSWTVAQGTNTLSVTVGSGFDWLFDTLYARFRLVSSAAAAPGGSLDQADFVGVATDGEVEDYFWNPGTLPVTLNAFSSDGAGGGEISVGWQTASETDNVGFELWGRVEGRWQTLGDFVPGTGMNSHLPHDYRVVVPAPPGLSQLQLVDYNSRGVIERYGPFRPGTRHGEAQAAQRIDWTEVRSEREQRLRARGFQPVGGEAAVAAESLGGQSAWKRIADGTDHAGSFAPDTKVLEVELSSSSATTSAAMPKSILVDEGRQTHVAVTDGGVQRVTYEALLDGGLDLAGVSSREIAVTWRGAPVARWIDGPRVFGPGSAIEFIGHPPEGDDALYVNAAHYQVSVNRRLAVAAKEMPLGTVPQPSQSYSKEITVDRPIMHHSQSPTGDPWVERTVLARSGVPATVTLDVEVDDDVLEGKHQLVLDLGTITDLPDVTGAGGAVVPEHNVEIRFAGPGSGFVPVATRSTSGQRKWLIEADLPAGLLATGLNQIQLRFTTEYLFSLVVIDNYGLRFSTPYRGPELDFAPDRRAHGYLIEGFARPNVVAYSHAGFDDLTRHQVSVHPSVSGYVAEFRQNRAASTDRLGGPQSSVKRFWVTDTPHSPAVVSTRAAGDLFSTPADLVVIAGSSFVGSDALEQYLADKAEFNPVVVDVEDIYNAVGYGMALPSAITDYLTARREIQPFSHVQLVGSDCYDRLNYISECVSFVPLPTAVVGPTRYSPSHNRLTDLDGDGIADVAVGQFSVRTENELATFVGKGWDWHASGLAAGNSALFIAEETDGTHDFLAQVSRVGGHLDATHEEILDMSAHPDIATAREALRAALDSGRAVTVFSGHSSAVQWAYRGLLTPSTVAGLTNIGRPTLMLPLACETTYDISPSANVLGHQLLTSGGQGAVAISGAVSLANLDDNERMADRVLEGLESGMTLGEAVQAGREALGGAYRTLQDNWLTQGDVTLRLER